MRELSKIDFIRYDIHLAKRALIKARIARQLATVAKEFDMYYGDNFTSVDEAEVLLQQAQDLRREAQELLRKVERLNGRQYLAGGKTFPLKDYLKGKLFKAWKEFDYEYTQIGAPFYGSDPE